MKSTAVLINTNLMKPPVTPIGLDYLGSALLRNGFEVDVIDLCFCDDYRTEIDSYFEKKAPLVVGMTIRNTDDCYFLSQDFMMAQIKGIVSHIKKRTDAALVLGGVGFSVMPEQILDYLDVDFGIWGDGEWAFPELLKRIQSGKNFGSLPGLVLRNGKGIRKNQRRFCDLDQLGVPGRDIVDNRRYFREGGMGSIETKRGCPMQCIYCADPISKGRRLRLRSPHLVSSELEVLCKQGIDHIHICDSEFNVPEEHTLALLREMIRKKLGERLRWYAYLRPVPFNREMASLMLRGGCQGIDFGVDHVNDGILKTLRRGYTKEDVVRTARICHEFGITFMYDLLLGGPGEDRQTLKEVIDCMKEISPACIGISAGIRIYPHTRLAGMVFKEGLNKGNPNLKGTLSENDGFLKPMFYLSSAISRDIIPHLSTLIGEDDRFFLGATEDAEKNYNYNENQILIEAIRKGYRGAFWDILRRAKTSFPTPE